MEPCKYEREIGEMSTSIQYIKEGIDEIKEDHRLAMHDIMDNHLSSIYKRLQGQIPRGVAIVLTALCSLSVGLIVFLATRGN